MNDTRNAEKAYRKSIELNPDNPEALINLIILEVNQGKIKEAEKNFHSFQEACLSCSAIDKEVTLIIHNIKSIYNIIIYNLPIIIIALHYPTINNVVFIVGDYT